jgi:hypothetical protein
MHIILVRSLAEMVKERESKKHTLALNQVNVFKKRLVFA